MKKHHWSCEWLATAVLLAVALTVTRANAQECFTSRDCQAGTSSAVSPFSPEACCLGDGFSYSDTTGGCNPCIVFGFAETKRVADESGFQESIDVTLLKGPAGYRSRNLVGRFTVSAVSTNATMPGDFTFNSPGEFVPGIPSSAMYTVMGDSVALEGNEVFELVINVISPVVSRNPADPPVILQPRVTITINDESVVGISFSENDYSLSENSPRHPGASIIRTGAIGTPVTVRVRQLTVDQVLEKGIVLRSDFPHYINRPRANVTDFVSGDTLITLEPSEDETGVVPIDIIPRDDLILEPSVEVFILILELVDAVDSTRVMLGPRGSALGIITDDDLISVGFEFPGYVFPETDQEMTYAVRLQKENDGRAERDVAVDVQLGAVMTATEGVDFNITLSTDSILFLPEEQFKDYFITIRPDNITEEAENFTLTVTTATGPFVLSTPLIPETVIYIIDDDELPTPTPTPPPIPSPSPTAILCRSGTILCAIDDRFDCGSAYGSGCYYSGSGGSGGGGLLFACVPGEFCNGVPECPDGSDEFDCPEFCRPDGQVRLANGTSDAEGRIEVCYAGVWGTVCDDGLDDRTARVVCRQLGYEDADRSLGLTGPENIFGPGHPDQPIWLDNVQCLGTERSIVECRHNGFGVHNCQHFEDAGAICAAPDLCHPDGQVRLVNGTSDAEGRIEICYAGEWGTVCDDFLDDHTARVVCRQLGYEDAGSLGLIGPENIFGPGHPDQPIWLDNVQCLGTERSIVECRHNGFGVHNCVHFEDAGAICAAPEPCHPDGQVRLANGTSDAEGRIEICYAGVWGTVCDDGLDGRVARVICRQLGYGDAGSVRLTGPENIFGPGHPDQPIWLDDVQCLGTERSIVECRHNGFGVHDCQHFEDAGAICAVPPPCLPNEFRCPSGGSCIPETLVCDGEPHCPFGGDEDDCPDPILVALYPNQFSLPENEGFTFPLHYCVEVLNGEVNRTVFVEVESVSDGFAQHGVDYRPFKDFILISPDIDYEISPEGRPMFCTFKYDVVIGDNEVERTDFEHFLLQVVPSPISGIQVPDNHRGTAVIFIVDDDIAEIDFDASEYAVGEGDGGVLVCVQLVGGHLSWPVTFRLSTADGSAYAGRDYNISGILPQIGDFPFTRRLSAIDAYVSENWCVFIPIIDDAEVEGNEMFFVKLFTPSVEVIAIHEMVQVTIVDNEEPCDTYGGIRLVGGANEMEGRVEVCLDGFWGTVCDDEWGLSEASVVCKQLGFESAKSAPCCAFYGRGSGPIHLDDVVCSGNENSLDECQHSGIGIHNCDHYEDAGVQCVGPLEVFFTNDTPIIRPGEREIEVLLDSNKPTSATCRLITRGQRTEQDCSPGTRVVFTNLESNSYTIRVLAVATETGEEEDFTRRINIPASSDDCVVNVINRGVIKAETQGDVVIEFTVSGNYTFLACRLDGVFLPSELCSSPVTLSGLSAGEHKLRVDPQGCRGDDRLLNIGFTV